MKGRKTTKARKGIKKKNDQRKKNGEGKENGEGMKLGNLPKRQPTDVNFLEKRRKEWKRPKEEKLSKERNR